MTDLSKSLNNSLGAAVLAGSLAASSAGCADTTESCRFVNPDKETAYSLDEAKDMCSANRNSIIKCITGDMDDHELGTPSAACIDEATANYILEKAFDDDSQTMCQTDAVIQCTSITDEGEETVTR